MDSDLVVTVRPTIMDGTVVDWFLSEAAARDVSRAIVSASRNGVHIDCWLHQLPDGLLDTAREIAALIRQGARTAEIEQLYATHNRAWGSRELTPIVRQEQP